MIIDFFLTWWLLKGTHLHSKIPQIHLRHHFLQTSYATVPQSAGCHTCLCLHFHHLCSPVRGLLLLPTECHLRCRRWSDWATISSGRPRQASKTQEVTVVKEGAFTFPAGVRLFSPSTIHFVHLSLIQSLNGLFRLTSSGCSTLVNPPGIPATSVLVWRSTCFTGSARWSRNESQTSKLFFFSRPPGHKLQTFCIHSFMPSASIQPLG